MARMSEWLDKMRPRNEDVREMPAETPREKKQPLGDREAFTALLNEALRKKDMDDLDRTRLLQIETELAKVEEREARSLEELLKLSNQL